MKLIVGNFKMNLLQKDIERFLYEIKEAGFPVKLDTNGCYPEKLAGILELGLADYVAMDIKNCPEKYAETVELHLFAPQVLLSRFGLIQIF